MYMGAPWFVVQCGPRPGPWQVGFSAVGGTSIHRLEADGVARDAQQSRLGRDLSDIKVGQSLRRGRAELPRKYSTSTLHLPGDHHEREAKHDSR